MQFCAYSYRAMKGYIKSVAVLFFIFSMAKFVTLGANIPLLDLSDPIFLLKNRYLLLLVAITEFLVAVLCILNKEPRIQITAIAWLSTNFMLYRIGLFMLGDLRHCACLGNFADALYISPQVADGIVKVALAYLLIGSHGLLIWEWRRRRELMAES